MINISTEAELRNYVTGINNGTITEGAILLNNINLTGGAMNCIGDADFISYPYTFDGNNKKVSNFTNLYPAKASQGFVGWTTSTAVVKNLTVEGTVSGASYTAGIVGQNRGDVYGCTFRGTINTTGYNCGGIIGNHSAPAGRIVHSCFANINYTGTAAGERHGGIIGYAVMGVTVHHCRARGTMNLNGGRAGGIVGVCQGTIAFDNYSSMNITVSAGNNFVGGAFGQTDNTTSITRCFSDGLVICGGSAVGGAIGYKDGTSVTNTYYNSTTSTRSDNDGRGVPLDSTQCLVAGNFNVFDFGADWEIRTNGPELQMFSDLPAAIPSVNATTLRFHAVRACTITPTLTFTGGPIEVFTETSQVGPVTNYTSQGTFVSGTPKSLVLTLGQRLYFAIPAGTSITAMDFTDDLITGKLDSEAIQIFATITLTNSGWRRWYIEKTVEYLNTRGFIGSFFAQTGLKGIYTTEALTARTTLMGAGATISVNLAQKGAGVYTFILPFITDAANQVYGASISGGISNVTVLIKNSGGSTLHTLTSGVVLQTIAIAGSYTAEWTVTFDGTSDTAVMFNTGTTTVHRFDLQDIPTALLNHNSNFSLNGEVNGDISELSEIDSVNYPRLTIYGQYNTNPTDIVGDIESLSKVKCYEMQLAYSPYLHGDVVNINLTALAHIAITASDRIIGDVGRFNNLAGTYSFTYSKGLTGSITAAIGGYIYIQGSPGIQGPINPTCPNYASINISGSGFTMAQLQTSIDGLYARLATFTGGIIARGVAPELVVTDPDTITKIQAFEAKSPAQWDIKTLLPLTTFYTTFNAAVGDIYNASIVPIAPFGNYKVIFPAGAFVRVSNSAAVTEWTEDLSPNVRCVVAGNHVIEWQLSWDGTSITPQFSISGTSAKHVFNVADLPYFIIQAGVTIGSGAGVTGSVAKFNNTAGIITISYTNIDGPVTGLTKAYGMYLEGSDVSGPINNCLVNTNWQLRNTKLTKADIQASLIYLNARSPLFTGYFICDTGMAAITDKNAIAAYNSLVARLGANNIKVNVDDSPSTPPVTAGRLTTSLKSRFRNLRRF